MLFQKCKSVVLDADVLPRKRLRNAYQILRKLGEGGQGAMYLAQHRRVGAKRCVKFYPKGAPNAPIEDILFEFEVMKTLDSPHVARTYEIFQDASQNSLQIICTCFISQGSAACHDFVDFPLSENVVFQLVCRDLRKLERCSTHCIPYF